MSRAVIQEAACLVRERSTSNADVDALFPKLFVIKGRKSNFSALVLARSFSTVDAITVMRDAVLEKGKQWSDKAQSASNVHLGRSPDQSTMASKLSIFAHCNVDDCSNVERTFAKSSVTEELVEHVVKRSSKKLVVTAVERYFNHPYPVGPRRHHADTPAAELSLVGILRLLTPAIRMTRHVRNAHS